MLWAQKSNSQQTSWIYWMTWFFHQWIFPSLMAREYSKMTMPGFITLKLWKSGSGSMRHHFHTWIGHHRVQTSTLLRIFGMCWIRLEAAARLSHHQYKILVKNECNTGRNVWMWHCRFSFFLITCGWILRAEAAMKMSTSHILASPISWQNITSS